MTQERFSSLQGGAGPRKRTTPHTNAKAANNWHFFPFGLFRLPLVARSSVSPLRVHPPRLLFSCKAPVKVSPNSFAKSTRASKPANTRHRFASSPTPHCVRGRPSPPGRPSQRAHAAAVVGATTAVPDDGRVRAPLTHATQCQKGTSRTSSTYRAHASVPSQPLVAARRRPLPARTRPRPAHAPARHRRPPPRR